MRPRLHPSTLLLPLLLACAGAHAICPVTLAGYGGGAFGSEAVASPGGCFRPIVGGIGISSATDSSDANGIVMSASANLSTGVLTAYATGGSASSSLWDTVTFSGLPAAGGTVTETLSLAGSMTNDAVGFINLDAGTGINGDSYSLANSEFTATASNFPAEFTATFTAQNGVPVLVSASLDADAINGISDLSDPPIFRLDVGPGVTFTSASGVFGSASPVPEPGSLAFVLAGLALLGARARRLPN